MGFRMKEKKSRLVIATSPCNGRSQLKLPGAPIVTSDIPSRSPKREQRVVLRTRTFNTGGLRVSDPSDEQSGSTPKEKREQPRRNTPRRHTLAISSPGAHKDDQSQHEKKREAFKDMLAKRFPKSSSERGDSSASEDGFPTKPGPGSRNVTRRRTTVVTYNPDASHSTDHDERNTSLSEVDTESLSSRQGGLQRGGLLRSSLPIVRSPNHSFERPLGLVFLSFGDETKRALLPNEITHLDTVRALFVRSFPDKINMQLFESRPQLKIYIQDQKSRVFYQLEDLRDIQDHSILKLHYCDSHEPQRVKEYTKVRGKSILSPPPPSSRSPSFHSDSGRKPTIDQASAKSKSLPAANSINLRDHIHVIGPQQMQELPEIRYRPLTPDVAHTSPDARWRLHQPSEEQRRMLPERPFSPDRLPLGTIPENRQPSPGSRKPPPPHDLGGQRSGQSTPTPQDMALAGPSSGRSTPTRPPLSQYTRHRPLSPSIEHLVRSPQGGQPGQYRQQRPPQGHYGDHLNVSPPTKPQAPTYVAKSVRAITTFSPLRATGPTQATRESRDRAGRQTSRHSLAFAPMSSGSPQQQQHSKVQQDTQDGLSRAHSISPQKTWVSNHANGQPCQRSQSYRVPVDPRVESRSRARTRSVTPQPQVQDDDPESRFRMDKMEAQLANLTAWVHTATKSVTSGSDSEHVSRSSSARSIQSDSGQTTSSSGSLNDLSTSNRHTQTSQRLLLSREVANGLLALYKKTQELKVELKGLRRLQQLNMEGAKESIQDVYGKIQATLMTVPGANNRPIRQLRFEVDTICDTFKMDEDRIRKELVDLETSVEEMRADVISRQCRVNMSDVEGMALALSQITKALADLKGRLPALMDQLKAVMSGEMEVVVTEERFLKDEPETIESCLKKCKKLTGTLFTLKRLASVQVQRPPQIPSFATNGQAMDAKNLVLENIQSMVPNHDARLQSLEAADASRERKRRLLNQQESLKFEKKLELASKNLKSSSEGTKDIGGSARSPELEKKATLPLTEITEKISNIGKTSATTTASKSRNVPKTLTITKSASTDGNGLRGSSKTQKQSARAVFFSGMNTPSPTSPPKITPKLDWVVRMPKSQSAPGVASTITELSPPSKTTASATSRIPSATLEISPSSPSNGGDKFMTTQPIRKGLDSKPPVSTSSGFSNIPQPVRGQGQAETATTNILHSRSRSVPGRDAGINPLNGEAGQKRRVPPPPPPRRTTQSSSNSFTSFCSTIVSPSKLDFSTSDQTNSDANQRKAQGRAGLPVASTPVVGAPRKPANRFEQGIMDVAVYVNVKQGGDAQTVSVAKDDGKAAVVSEVSKESGQQSESGNDIESEGESTSSVDSQHEIWRLRSGVKPQTQSTMQSQYTTQLKQGLVKTDAPTVARSISHVSVKKKLPPPPPPARKTSVLTKRDLTERIQEQSTRTQHLQDQYSKLQHLEREQEEMIHQHHILEADQSRKKDAKKTSGK